MASWGPKLYQDDIAEDVRSYYKEQLKHGKSNEIVTEELINNNRDIISDKDDAPIFWFSLADTQWELGRLLPFVKEKALEHLRDGSNLRRWQHEAANQKEYRTREKVLNDLEVKLTSPMPEEKKITQHKLYKCEWKIGDVFSYKLMSEYAKEVGLYNRYLLIRKVSEDLWWPGHIVPIIHVKITKGEQLPSSIDEIGELEYIVTSRSKGGPEYLITMISTSKRVIPTKDLLYLGNYENLPAPKDEYIPHEKISIPSCNWSSFEKTIVDKYLRLNFIKD